MSDSMVDRLDDHEPVTITEALDIPQPRAVGSPLPRGNGNRVSVPPTYSELEERPMVSHLGPVLASAGNFTFAPGQLRSTAPVAAPVPEPAPISNGVAPATTPVPASLPTAPLPAFQAPVAEAAPATPLQAPAERQGPLPIRTQEHPSTMQRAAGMIRQAIPIVQKLLPLLDGNIAGAVTNILKPPPAPTAALAPPPAPARVDLTPLKQEIAELQVLHKDLLDQVAEQNSSLKRVEDHLQLVREATDRNTLEQQELMEDLKSMGSKVNVVAAVAIGLLAVSLLVNMVLYMHIQRVLP